MGCLKQPQSGTRFLIVLYLLQLANETMVRSVRLENVRKLISHHDT